MPDDINVAGIISPEIVRLCKDFFNYSEPPVKASVTAVNGNSVNVSSPKFSETNIPVLQSCFSDPESSPTLNIAVGDQVLICFIGGHEGNPVIVGKF